MIKVLSIGNSFSRDAQRYLHGIARADKVELLAVNLYIGGCTLYTHYRNMLSGRQDYVLEVNGEQSGLKVTMEHALMAQEWDYITLQQGSNISDKYDTYEPFIQELAAYVRKCCPKAKLLIHETWAYEEGSDRLLNMMGYKSHHEMYLAVHKTYERAAKDIKADGIIPCGTVYDRILADGVATVHCDTFHSAKGIGRYALGLTWYRILTGNSVMNNPFSDFDEEVSEKELKIVKNCVESLEGLRK